MTSVSDPFHPQYLDEFDLRAEVARSASVCGECRACVSRCDVFPRLFELLERSGPGLPAAPGFTPVEQDHVVDACFDCGLCAVGCPEGPGLREDPIQIPQLMARARQIRARSGSVPVADRLVSGVRRVSHAIAAPLTTRSRFSTWFRKRPDGAGPDGPADCPTVALFPTCHVEHHDPALGRDLVAVYEHAGVRCTLPEGLQCCGAPQLDAGDIHGFVSLARRNVRRLAEAVRSGREIIVPQPNCLSAIRTSYPAFVGGADADLVAEHVHDSSAYLVDFLESGSAMRSLSVSDAGHVLVHAPCRLRSMGSDIPAAMLLERSGFEVEVVTGCASPDPRVPAGALDRTIESFGSVGWGTSGASDERSQVVGDCPSAGRNLDAAGAGPVEHPVRLLARRLGLTAD